MDMLVHLIALQFFNILDVFYIYQMVKQTVAIEPPRVPSHV